MPRLLLWLTGLSIAATAGYGSEHDDALVRNWHQWRGPAADGVAPHGDPPVTWSESQNVKWKVAVPGEGHATPIVWDDQVFVLSAVMTDRQVDQLEPPKQEPPGGYRTARPKHFYQFTVHSFDRETGALRWRRVACEALPHAGRHDTNTFASGSPTTDGQRLYVPFGSQGLYCYDLQGRLLWQRDFGPMITRLGWGEGTSPVVYDDFLVVNWDHEGDSFVAVLDAATGETRWRKDREEVTSWATPRVISHQGRQQVVIPATRRITSYDLATGEKLWECGGLTSNVIPCPAVYGDLVICMSGHQGTAVLAIRLDSRGDVSDSDRQVAWRLERDTPYVPSPLLYGDLLYFTRSNTAVLTCVDPATGKILRSAERLPQLRNIYASPVGAADRVYFTSREGSTLVAKRQAQLDVLAINQLDDGIDASPAIAGRALFLRGHRYLYCLREE